MEYVCTRLVADQMVVRSPNVAIGTRRGEFRVPGIRERAESIETSRYAELQNGIRLGSVCSDAAGGSQRIHVQREAHPGHRRKAGAEGDDAIVVFDHLGW